jgi:hypothetical protein
MRVNGNGKAAIGQANDGRRLVNVLFGSILSSKDWLRPAEMVKET